uniref:MADF domain-containing protein n=1 Tax=Panagrellus redivivus TaxID=6233 RepID=A0A7E4ZS99_PANRE
MDDPASPGYVPPGSHPSDDNRPPTFNELLIHEVRAHPELYDQQHRVCTDNGERNLIWESIAASIDDTVTGEFAKKRWLQMRDRYRKELKSSIRSRTIPKWPYYSKLSWLEPFLKENKPGAISASFIGHGFPGFDASDVSLGDQNKLIDFSNYAAASTLFENIMAASGNFGQLGDCKPTLLSGEFSPDSAVASTSEDGDHRNFQPSSSMERPDSGDGGSLLNPYNPTAGLLVKLEAINAAAAAASNDSQLDAKLLNAIRGVTASSPPTMALRSSSLVSNTSTTSASASASASTSRTRNPPYLVRRGGGLKVKPPSNNNKDLRKLVTPSRDNLGQVSPSRSVSESSTSDTSSTRNATMTNAQKIDAIEAAFAAKEWANDEDMLFARLVVVRLKKFASKERRGIRARISELIDEKEEEIEVVKKMMPPTIMPSIPTTSE